MQNVSEAELAERIADLVVAKLARRLERRLLSRKEFAELNGVGVRTVDRAIKEGRLPCERVGKRVLIDCTAKIHSAS